MSYCLGSLKQIKKPLAYISGGKISDFIQQMSVIYEKYQADKRPATLYISDRGDDFRFGVQKAYEDLHPIVSAQPYINEFKIHQGEPYDVDLSRWRRHAVFRFKDNYLEWMKKEYDVEWGKHKWLLNIPTHEAWKDKVVINTTQNRFPTMVDWEDLFEKYKIQDFVFVGFEKKEHSHFTKTIHHIPFYRPQSLMEMCVLIHSCKLFVGSLSSPLSIALALHRPHQIGLYNDNQRFDLPAFSNMGKNIPSTIMA